MSRRRFLLAYRPAWERGSFKRLYGLACRRCVTTVITSKAPLKDA